MRKNINKVQISVLKVLYKGHEGEKLRPEIYSAELILNVVFGFIYILAYNLKASK
jgi:hypothetical protein